MQTIVKAYRVNAARAVWELWDERDPRQTPNERGYMVRYFPDDGICSFNVTGCAWIVPGTLQ